MYYISTRGSKNSQKISGSEAIIRGLATDGGLYVPEKIPAYNYSISDLPKKSYEQLAYEVLSLYFTDFTKQELKNCIHNAYGSGFDNDKIAPLVNTCGTYFLELFHGQTIAFKDMALSILPHLMTTSAKKLGIDKEIIILAATSGDTGKAALAGFANVAGTKIIVFYPEGGVSEIQRLQMVTQEGENAYVLGVKGNFDDAQRGVKQIFTNKKFIERAEREGVLFSSANSINIGRLVPQIVYYFYAYGQLLANGAIKENEPINFVVPTGNFGNILAGFYAKQMGLPIKTLVCASNSNKVLYDFFKNKEYDANREFVLTISPSMDILVSSNLERLIYAFSDGEKTAALMEALAKNGQYQFEESAEGFAAEFATEEETQKAIYTVHKNGYTIDTHTAVAYAAYEKYCTNSSDETKTVIVSTASPYKFANDVCTAINAEINAEGGAIVGELERLSGIKIPEAIRDLDKKAVLHDTVIFKNEMQETVQKIINLL